MIGCFITRGLVLVLGYAYPAYECFKTVEMNKPDIEQLLFWCQYWILVAGLTVCERIGDMFIGWVPMYSEAKLAFFIYLWYPKTKGTRYVYDSFFRPYVAKHETEIDRSLCELRTRAGDMAFLYWQKAASYGQTRVFDILQYFASQSNPPRPSQQAAKSHKPTTPSKRSAATTQLQKKEPQSPTSSASSSQPPEDTEVDGGPSVGPGGAPVATASSNGSKTSTEASKEVALPTTTSEGPKATSTQALVKASKSLGSSEEKMMLISSVPPPASENVQPPPQETILEVKRRTGARLKKTRTRCCEWMHDLKEYRVSNSEFINLGNIRQREMISSGINLVMIVIGFAVSSMFIVFVFTRLICAQIHLNFSRRSFAMASGSNISILEQGAHGIEPLVVADFPTKSYGDLHLSSEEDAQCTICLAEYLDEDALRILLVCGHSFHATCIDRWLQKHPTCPVCRICLRENPERK